MFIRASSKLALFLVLLVLLVRMTQSALGTGHYITKEIKYKTDDGWTISGTLRLPPGASQNNAYPVMVLLHENEHDRNEFVGIGENPGIAQRLPAVGIATLNIDLRGRGVSMGKGQPVEHELHDLATQTTEKTYLDVTGAMKFLADYPGVDSFRLGILATQYSVEHAVRAMQNSAIPTRALVLLGGEVSQESKDYLATVNIPIFTGSSISEKSVFQDMADVYVRAKNINSYMVAPYAAGQGYHVLFLEQLSMSGEGSRVDYLIQWLGTNVKGLGRNRAITLTTQDGFTIQGNFRYPDDLGKNGKKIPGVVIAPGGRSNRYSYYVFEEEMARRGIAVVSVEQRGRGQSMLGKTVEDPEIAKLWAEDPTESPYFLDVVAGIDFLVSQEGIDPDRIGLMGGARGTRNATLAAAVNPTRIKAMVLASVYYDEQMKDIFSKLDASVLLVDGELNDPKGAIEAHKVLKNGELVLYPGMGQSHHIRYLFPEMIDMVGDFLERELILH